MAALPKVEEAKKKARIEIIPLIDVIFSSRHSFSSRFRSVESRRCR